MAMQLRFLETSEHGLRWMRRYYRLKFPEGQENAQTHFLTAKSQLLDQPYSGHLFDDFENVREMNITNTPFSILYTIRDETIYVIDIRGQRGMRSHEALAAFVDQIRKRHGL